MKNGPCFPNLPRFNSISSFIVHTLLSPLPPRVIDKCIEQVTYISKILNGMLVPTPFSIIIGTLTSHDHFYYYYYSTFVVSFLYYCIIHPWTSSSSSCRVYLLRIRNHSHTHSHIIITTTISHFDLRFQLDSVPRPSLIPYCILAASSLKGIPRTMHNNRGNSPLHLHRQ